MERPRQLSHAELRRTRPNRTDFRKLPRRPITVLLDGVNQNYNIGAIFRLCDTFLVQRLIIAGRPVDLRNRKLAKAARGTHRWVPWSVSDDAFEIVRAAKKFGLFIIAAEQTSVSLGPSSMAVQYPALLVLGGETSGISPQILDWADTVIALPMLGMANNLNVATAAAILLYEISRGLDRPGLTFGFGAGTDGHPP
jgi:23S rRNA (guanosine2251-2'-O)-methyltransferase